MSHLSNQVQSIIQQYDRFMLTNIDSCLDKIIEVGQGIEEALLSSGKDTEDPEQISTEDSLNKCDETFKKLLIQKLEVEAEKKVFSDMLGKLTSNVLKAQDVESWFENELKKEIERLDKSDASMARNHIYKNFRETIWQVRHPEEAFNLGDDDDDDIQMVGTSEKYTCPITVLIDLI